MPSREKHEFTPVRIAFWIIGPGLSIETEPTCPVHGDYHFSPVIPETGTLASPCRDPAQRPPDTHDW